MRRGTLDTEDLGKIILGADELTKKLNELEKQPHFLDKTMHCGADVTLPNMTLGFMNETVDESSLLNPNNFSYEFEDLNTLLLQNGFESVKKTKNHLKERLFDVLHLFSKTKNSAILHEKVKLEKRIEQLMQEKKVMELQLNQEKQENTKELNIQVEVLKSKLKERDLHLIQYKDKLNDVFKKNNVSSNALDLKIELQTIKKELELLRKTKTKKLTEKMKKRNSIPMKNQIDSTKKIQLLQDKIAKLEIANEEYRVKAESRLTDKERRKLEKKVQDLGLQLRENTRVKEIQKYMSTRDVMKRDKKLHHLGLKDTSKLPAKICQQLLEDICMSLNLNNSLEIVDYIQKLQKITKTIPKIEKFIRDICDVILESGHADELVNLKKNQPLNVYHNIIPTLQNWIKQLHELQPLISFKTRLTRLLETRKNFDHSTVLYLNDICEQVEAFVRTEDDQCPESHNTNCHTCIIDEIKNIYNINNNEKIINTLNTISNDLTAKTNCLNQVKNLLKIERTSSLHHITNTIENIVGDKSIDIVNELVEETDCPEEQLINLVKEMKQKISDLSRLEDVYPRLVQLIGRAREVLEVKSTSEIIPMIEKLKNNSDDNNNCEDTMLMDDSIMPDMLEI